MNLNNIDIQFGNVIRKFREARGYTQETFSELCEISHAYYGRIERGEHSITLGTCKKIADALALPLYELFRDIP